MSLKVTGEVVGLVQRSYEAIDKKSGQKITREVVDIRIQLKPEDGTSQGFAELGVACFDKSQVIAHLSQIVPHCKIEIACRQLKEQAGFFQIYGDLIKVVIAENAGKPEKSVSGK